jgi:hypothetical protein
MRIEHLGVPATVLALLLATGVVFAGPSGQTASDPTPTFSPTSILIEPSPTVVIIISDPPVNGAPVVSSTLPIGEAPLSLAQRASSENASPGSEVRYTIQIASSRAGAVIETQSLLPAQLRLLGASISGGNCTSTGAVICRTTIGESGSATIEIVTQVLPNASIGSTIISQTLVQDDLSYTAASDQTAVTIVAAPTVQKVNAQPAKPSQPTKPVQSAKPSQPTQPSQPLRDPQSPAISDMSTDRTGNRNVPPAIAPADPRAWPIPEQGVPQANLPAHPNAPTLPQPERTITR